MLGSTESFDGKDICIIAKFNSLNNIQIKQAKPREKSYYLFDGLGLYLKLLLIILKFRILGIHLIKKEG